MVQSDTHYFIEQSKKIKLKQIFIFILTCTSLTLSGQDLIERTKLGIPSNPDARPSLVGERIFRKSNLKKLELFRLSTEKSNLPVEGVELVVNSAKLSALHKKQEYELTVPVEKDKIFSVKVYPYDIRAASYKSYTSDGVDLNASAVSFYKGVVADDPASSVHLTVTQNELSILIIDAFGMYNLGPLNESDDYILYNDKDLGAIPFACHSGEAIDVLNNLPQLDNLPGDIRLEKSGECVKIYTEIDYQSYLNFGSSATTAENFVLSSFGQVAMLYENLYPGSSNSISVEVSEVKVWTSDDPYGAESNVGTALNRLNATINPQNVSGDLVHLISAKNSNSFSGVAYVSCSFSGPCKSSTIGTNSPFAVSQTSTSYRNVPSYSWTVNVLAHEMGHNMGSPHTQACAWGPNNNTAIDGCVSTEGSCSRPAAANPGTIMSYCHITQSQGIDLSLGFGPEVGNHLYSEFLRVSNIGLNNTCQGSPDPEPEMFCESSLMINQNEVVDFENQVLGIWINENSDDIDWTVSSGRTPSSFTGPSSAFEGSNYIYLESSQSNHPAKSGTLITECINIFELLSPELSFVYHMHGGTMGSLTVRIITETISTIVFQASGNQGNQWIEENIDLSSYQHSDFQIEIEGITGNSWQSDIAIDLLQIVEETVSCTDGIQNGDEAGIDCSGTFCQPCFDCQVNNTNLTSNSIISSDEVRIVRDNLRVNAPVTIQNEADVFWQAGIEISIESSFEIKLGSALSLQVDKCTE